MDGDIIVLDLETQKSFKDVGRDKLHKLKISVAGLYSYDRDEFFTLEENEILTNEDIFKKAGLIIGFNSDGFDLPVLAPYIFTSIEDLPSLDLMSEIEKVRGHRVTLQSVAEATLKKGKSGSGKEALDLYRDGKMEELKRYCLDDVRITKEVYEYGNKHGKVYFRSNRDFRVHEVPVDWAKIKPRKNSTAEAFPTSLF